MRDLTELVLRVLFYLPCWFGIHARMKRSGPCPWCKRWVRKGWAIRP